MPRIFLCDGAQFSFEEFIEANLKAGMDAEELSVLVPEMLKLEVGQEYQYDEMNSPVIYRIQ